MENIICGNGTAKIYFSTSFTYSSIWDFLKTNTLKNGKRYYSSGFNMWLHFNGSANTLF
jgi:hypothetical protein